MKESNILLKIQIFLVTNTYVYGSDIPVSFKKTKTSIHFKQDLYRCMIIDFISFILNIVFYLKEMKYKQCKRILKECNDSNDQ